MFILPFILLNKKGIFFGGSHTIPLFGMKNILVIHDLVAFEYPETMTYIGKILNKSSVYLSILFSDRIVSVSKFTKERLESLFPKILKNKNIEIIPNSVDKTTFYKDINLKMDIKNITNKILNNYLLAVGTIEPRKNILELLKAYRNLLEKNIYKGKLILVGASGWKNKDIHEYIRVNNLQKDVILPGYLQDNEINYLMNNCDLFVFPSLYEGFGIPPLEAYCSGAKVLTTIYSEMPNLNIDDFIFYDPLKDNLSEKILLAVNMNYCRHSKYHKTWNNSSSTLINVIENLKK
jgi:glycosyltransferase involved in cell wall biosynthesis